MAFGSDPITNRVVDWSVVKEIVTIARDKYGVCSKRDLDRIIESIRVDVHDLNEDNIIRARALLPIDY